MIDKLQPSSTDRAAARAFADKIEPMDGPQDQEFVPRPPPRSREEINRLTDELFAKLRADERARQA